MNGNDRVLSRQHARELAYTETDHVKGGITTLLSVCSIPQPGQHGCDPDHSS